jgi:uncharacterized membrane protein
MLIHIYMNIYIGPSIERAVGQFTAALAPMTLGGDPDIKPVEEDYPDKESQSKNTDTDIFDRERGAKDQDSESATLLNEASTSHNHSHNGKSCNHNHAHAHASPKAYFNGSLIPQSILKRFSIFGNSEGKKEDDDTEKLKKNFNL